MRRGDLTVWLTEEAVAAGRIPATGARGGQPFYLSRAIETGLALRVVFHQPLCQTEGMLRSIAAALKVDIAISDHTTLNRRGGAVAILPRPAKRDEPLRLLIDSPGLKMCGEGEWLAQRRGLRSRRRWRKLHLGCDADMQEIVTAELTSDDVGDVAVLPERLDQFDGVAEGAHDSEAAGRAVANRQPQSSFYSGRQPFQAAPRQRSATGISPSSWSLDASPGGTVRATAVKAWLKP